MILERIDETTDKINSVAVLLWEWRTRMTALMSGTLTAEEADEEDYARRAEQEEKLDIMLDLYRQVLYVWLLMCLSKRIMLMGLPLAGRTTAKPSQASGMLVLTMHPVKSSHRFNWLFAKWLNKARSRVHVELSRPNARRARMVLYPVLTLRV